MPKFWRELMMSQLVATLSGVNFVLHSAEIIESYMVSSYEKFVMDDEICGMCKRIRKGEKADAGRLAVDLIRQVGPGGEYLTQLHTFQNFRKEFYEPLMEERDHYEGWQKKGALSLEQRANKKWKEILEKYSVKQKGRTYGK